MQIGGDRYIARVDPITQSRTLLASVPADNPTMPPWVHDVAGTENYIILADTPTVHDFSVKVSLQGVSGYVWNSRLDRLQVRSMHLSA